MLIKDLEFNPVFTEAQYDRCIQFFEEDLGEVKKSPSCTKFIIVGDNEPELHKLAACHSAIGSRYVSNVALVGTEIALIRKELKKCKAAWKFLEWMLNDSFASRFIVNKPEHKTLEWVAENGIIVSSDVIQPLFQMIMIFSRTFSERSETQFNKWKELVDDGFDPHFAYQVCMCVTAGKSPEQEFLPKDMVVYSRTGHTTTYLLNMACMKLFCEGELGVCDYQKKTYRQLKSVHGCHLLFQANAAVISQHTHPFFKDLFASDQDFVERMKAFRNVDMKAEGYRPPNPFTRSRFTLEKKPDDVTYEEYFEVVIPYMKEKGMFYNVKEN
jgi:hypothetical protein